MSNLLNDETIQLIKENLDSRMIGSMTPGTVMSLLLHDVEELKSIVSAKEFLLKNEEEGREELRRLYGLALDTITELQMDGDRLREDAERWRRQDSDIKRVLGILEKVKAEREKQ